MLKFSRRDPSALINGFQFTNVEMNFESERAMKPLRLPLKMPAA